ncbi:MAG: extracellular solute-binding protein [Deltaproteobacteria bacterium]|nr:extracellular solute-binding protein [Deltaproteobacteria bacterium]
MRPKPFCFLLGIGIGLMAFLSMPGVPALAKDAAQVLAEFRGLSPSEREKRLVAGAKKEGKVIYYGSGNVRDNQQILQGFKKRYPFLEVEYSGGGGSRVVQRTYTEFVAKHYVLDVVNANSFRMPTLLEVGALAKYESPHRRDLAKELSDPKGILYPLYTTAVVMAYNTAQVKPQQVPKSYSDLLKPEWKGRKMALDTEAHSWFMGILGTMGEKKGMEYARKLAGQEMVRRRGHTLMAQLLAVGEFTIQVEAYLHSLIKLKQIGAPVDVVIPDPVILRPPSAVALAKKAPHPHAAALLIDYMLSPEGGQKIFAAQNRWPSNRKTPTKFTLGDVKVWAPALDEWLPRQKEVLQKFDEVFGGRGR